MEFRRLVFEGAIPVEFRFQTEEHGPAKYYYVMAPRVSYFGLLLPHIRKHLIPESTESELQLEYNGHSLKCHYPIGLLHDIHCGDSVSNNHQSLCCIPWRISIKEGNKGPSSYLGPTEYRKLEEYFMSMLKQASIYKSHCIYYINLARRISCSMDQ